MLSFRGGKDMAILVLGSVSWKLIIKFYSRRTKNIVNRCIRNKNRYKD